MISSLRDEKEKVWSDEDQSLLAEHLKFWKPGTDNPLQEPIRFLKKSLVTLNPMDKGLTPEEMIGRTFLMPPPSCQDYVQSPEDERQGTQESRIYQVQMFSEQ